MFRTKGWLIAFVLAVPLAVATLGVYLLTFDLLQKISTGANQAEHERNVKSVTAAIKTVERQIELTVFDNSLWDEAANNVYKDIDAEWLYNTWGATTEDGGVYDAVLIVEHGQERAIAGYISGEPDKPLLKDYFGQSFTEMLARFPPVLSAHSSEATLDLTSRGLAVVAAAPVMSPLADKKIPDSPPRFLVFVRYLTPAFVERLAKDHVVDSLTITAGKVEPAMVILRDAEGHVVATANWENALPGDAAFNAVKLKAFSALVLLLMVMLGIGAFCWWLIKSLADREAAARHDSLTDPLTGLPNRAALTAEMDKANRLSDSPVAIVFADLDGFKEVNDQHDHHFGDLLIRQVATTMSGLIGPDAFLARAGGDEFVAIFSGETASAQAIRFAEHLIAILKEPFSFDGKFAVVGASLGMVTETSGTIATSELMRRADVAMYEAKARGKNRACTYTPTMDEARLSNARIASELREQLDKGMIDVVFQPIVDARNFTIVAAEALARWPRDTGSSYPPDVFIGVAERNGLIDQLGELVLGKCCLHAKAWPKLRLSINISPLQLRNPMFVERSLAIMAEHGIDPSRFEFEVTEGVLLDNWPLARVQFQRLRAQGIAIALDDFGAGYSSIGYLRHADFDRIKIDRAIVHSILAGSREQSLVQGTILMAAGMSAKVTAEGVESADEAMLLRLAGCHELQGYYFHKPVAAAELTRLLAEPPAALQA